MWLDPDQNPSTLRFLAACEEAGVPYVNDYNGASQLGVGKTQVPGVQCALVCVVESGEGRALELGW